MDAIEALNRSIISCRLCPRLVAFRETVPVKRGWEGQPHWRRPVPGFGDVNGRLLILGLAPSIEVNRTGRPFTGDASGRFLYKMLFEEGFANQPTSESMDDGLELIDCYITAAVKCVPPGHKPLKEEVNNCSRYYESQLALFKRVSAVLTLGKLSFDTHLHFLKGKGIETKGIIFKHGAVYHFEKEPTLFAAYHPSPRNTQTGQLTPHMFKSVLREINTSFKRISF